MRARSWIVAIGLIAVYAAIMIGTNTHFAILDDESTIIAIAAHPVLPTIKLFLSGRSQHEHPPASDILLHLWLAATRYSFFMLRIFANIFYIAAALCIALTARKLAGERAFWGMLIVSLAWPFAFHYGRIAGWYCVTMFLVALLTGIYLKLLDGRDSVQPWAAFVVTSIVLVWTNYFGVAVLFLLLADLLIYHRDLAARRVKSVAAAGSLAVLSFLPLLRVTLTNVGAHGAKLSAIANWKQMLAVAGYPLFSVFGSVAVAPWYFPLSIPIALSVVALSLCLWFSPARKWFVYYALTLVLLGVSGHMDVKRMLFLLPWMFLAIGLAMFGSESKFPRAAMASVAVMMIAGWTGILLGNHYATTNTREPWDQVAKVVAPDARSGATVVSENQPFFLYLDYQLGMQSEMTNTTYASYLGEDIYRSRGFKVLRIAAKGEVQEASLTGKVVVVNGSAELDDVIATYKLNESLRRRCSVTGEYKAAPDPSQELKKNFVSSAYAMPYRVDVTWYECPVHAM
jgi:hypothetical protein